MAATGTDRPRVLPWNAALRPGMLKTTFHIPERSEGGPPSQEAAFQVCVMRRLALVLLVKCGLNHLADDVALIVSELTTNAIVHSGGTEITLSLDIDNDVLHIAVRDGMPGRPAARAPDDDEENGRGLQLVRWIAGERHGAWGTSDEGATTWCDLPVAEVGR
ncbi:hypothetical protein GCM10009716_36800 [Streptomyces sodiiphilus]|uniref:Histidine kinase/HSP90-like ATPase domain-containing protein n=2 Tax=Streptomyces sodiiphilus TaxID=226217 RepID=A0ABN2PLR4_9ACTN